MFGGDLTKAKAFLEKYITELAFVMKNPTLGYNPGSRQGFWTFNIAPVPRVYPFSDKITDADREKALGIALEELPAYLTGENREEPLGSRLHGMFSQLADLKKFLAEHHGFLGSTDDEDAYDDLSGWSEAFFDAYRRRDGWVRQREGSFSAGLVNRTT